MFGTDWTIRWQTYRYSNLARYSIIDLEKNIVYPLEPQQLPRAANEPQEQLRYATWNKESNGLVYVYKNNIYYRSAPDSLVDTQITDDGQADAIFNGVPDWVYEGASFMAFVVCLFVFFVVKTKQIMLNEVVSVEGHSRTPELGSTGNLVPRRGPIPHEMVIICYYLDLTGTDLH